MTSFRVASPTDYPTCYQLMDHEGMPEDELELGFPTVLAFDEGSGEIVGFLGSHFQDELLIAGPLVLRKDAIQVKTTVNLCEAYETALRSLGVKSYIMHVEDGTFMDEAIQRYNPPGLELYAREGNKNFYIRRLTNGQQS